MDTLCVILARAGSKGLPDKCVRPLLGRPLIEYTFDHALAAKLVDAVVLSTDSDAARRLAAARNIETINRPADLASDAATVDAALRHAVETWERRHNRRAGTVVMLYGNIPVRRTDAIDEAIRHLQVRGGTSVRSVAPIGRHHPDWLHRLTGDRMTQYRANSIYRRQDLEPLFYHDGAVIVVTRSALFAAQPGDSQSFLGDDRRAIVQRCEDAVDVDGPADLILAEATLRSRDGDRRQDSAPNAAQTKTHNPIPKLEVPALAVSDRKDITARTNGVYVIAEAGVNHDGNFDDARRLIDAAVASGANAVKFQAFRANDLTRADAPTAAYQRESGGDTQRRMLQRLELEPDIFSRLADQTRSTGLDFIITPFGIDDLATARRCGSVAIKIASTDLNNVLLLQPATALGLPLILSTGAATAAEIDAAVARLREWHVAERTVLLHCVSAYPTPPAAANLGAIAALAQRTGLPVGYSDHTAGVVTGALAVAAGACVLEKHITLDRSRPGPDHSFSLEPTELREYIARVREAETLRGDGRVGHSPIESDVRLVARKSLCFAQSLRAGTIVRAEMLTAKRPGDGIAPDRVGDVVGRKLAQDVAADSPVAWRQLRQE